MKAKHWYDYLWVYAILYFALGFFNILFAWLGMIDFLLPLLLAIFGGNKFFCNHLCGRGQLFSKLGTDLKCSRCKPTPRWMSSKWFRYGFLLFFLTMFGNMVFQTYLVAAGAASLREAIKLFWTFRVPWGWTYTAGTVADWVAQFSFGFYSLMLTSLLIGLIVAVYLLASRKKLVKQAKMILYSIFKPRWAQLIQEEVLYADRMFGGFINGKIMDSAIIGVLCYFACIIFKFPSALLVSVIIGVTNVIPFFGPFIGAIPATLLILIQNPIKALWFVLFVLVLQQLDGNVIGPKILGNTTGLSSFWVLFSILLFGGLWGFVGMIVGVPLFAVIYDIIKKLVFHGLRRNGQLGQVETYHEEFGDPDDPAPAPAEAESETEIVIDSGEE